MKTIRSGAEYRLKDQLQLVRQNITGWSATLYRLSTLKKDKALEAEKEINSFAQNYLAEKDGALFFCEDSDIILLVHGMDELTKEKLGLVATSAVVTFTLKDDLSLDALCAQKIEALRAAPRPSSPKTSSAKLATEIEATLLAQLIEQRAARDKPCVMLVEDDAATLFITRRALAQDFKIITASTAAQAISLYKETAPDIVFLDIGLPDSDGHSVLVDIKTLDPQAFVVMLSGNSFRDDIAKAIKLGARGFVGKPFTRAKLLDYVTLWSKKRRTHLTPA